MITLTNLETRILTYAEGLDEVKDAGTSSVLHRVGTAMLALAGLARYIYKPNPTTEQKEEMAHSIGHICIDLVIRHEILIRMQAIPKGERLLHRINPERAHNYGTFFAQFPLLASHFHYTGSQAIASLAKIAVECTDYDLETCIEKAFNNLLDAV